MMRIKRWAARTVVVFQTKEKTGQKNKLFTLGVNTRLNIISHKMLFINNSDETYVIKEERVDANLFWRRFINASMDKEFQTFKRRIQSASRGQPHPRVQLRSRYQYARIVRSSHELKDVTVKAVAPMGLTFPWPIAILGIWPPPILHVSETLHAGSDDRDRRVFPAVGRGQTKRWGPICASCNR